MKVIKIGVGVVVTKHVVAQFCTAFRTVDV
jgi:hypothetical protein